MPLDLPSSLLTAFNQFRLFKIVEWSCIDPVPTALKFHRMTKIDWSSCGSLVLFVADHFSTKSGLSYVA